MEKGFTVLELLIVICIIGILASMLFISTTGYLAKAMDARIMASMVQMIKIAEIIRIKENVYNISGSGREFNCSANAIPEMKPLCRDIDKQKGPAANEFPAFQVTSNRYCAYIKLLDGNYFCIDYLGVSSFTNMDPGLNNCNASSHNCPPAPPEDSGC